MNALMREKWTLTSAVIVGALYAALLSLRPSGEGWGRGWNMIAVLFYGSPVALPASAVAFWRAGKASGSVRMLALATGVLGVAFPLAAIIALRIRS